jgi:hypothetical protein
VGPRLECALSKITECSANQDDSISAATGVVSRGELGVTCGGSRKGRFAINISAALHVPDWETDVG